MAGITEELQREIDAWCSNKVELYVYPPAVLPRWDSYEIAPPQAEIAKLKGELESARDEAAQSRKLAATAIYERDIALRALAKMIQHFMYPPAPAPAEEDPAVRAVRVMQTIGAAR